MIRFFYSATRGFIMSTYNSSASRFTVHGVRIASSPHLLIPTKLGSRWITIEYGNPKCTPLKESSFGRELVIPESGFLCTSSPVYSGWHRREYYLFDENNNRSTLQSDDLIHQHRSFVIHQGRLSDGTSCNVAGVEFFYGPKEKLTPDNPIKTDEAFLKLHPECRSNGPN